VLLLAAGLVALLYAMRLTALTFGCDLSPFAYLSLPDGHGAHAWLLAGALAGLVALVLLVVRHGDDRLWLPGEGGGVSVPAAALGALAERAASAHPDVVRAEAFLKVRRGELAGDVRLYVRPLADGAAVGAASGEAARAALESLTGRSAAAVAARPRVLTVRQLTRYLP
jgi:hypothetical protein